MENLKIISISLGLFSLLNFHTSAFPSYQQPVNDGDPEINHCSTVSFVERGHNTYIYHNERVTTCFSNKTVNPRPVSLYLKSHSCSYKVKTFPGLYCPSGSNMDKITHHWNARTKFLHLNQWPVCSIFIENPLHAYISLRVNFESGRPRIFHGNNWICANICEDIDENSVLQYPTSINISPIQLIPWQSNIGIYSKAGCFEGEITQINSNFSRLGDGRLDLAQFTKKPDALSYQILMSD